MSEFTYSDDLPSGWKHLVDKRDEFDKARADEWHTTMAFGADSINHVLEEYIGAPCGSEDNTAKATYLELHGTGYRYGIDYPKEGVNSRQTINLQDTGQHTMDQWFKSLTSDVTERPKKEEVRDSNWLTKELDRAFNEQYVRELKVWNNIMNRVDDSHYSKLSNVNINNGQDSTFCFNNSFKEKPAPQGSKPSDFLEEHIKLGDKLVNKSKTYRPLPDCLTIKESSIDGLGVFATEDIILDRFYTFLGYTHYVVDGELFRVNYGGFLNHSNTPNCKLYAISKEENYEAYQLIPIVDIKAGTELTLNYNNELCGLSDYNGAEFLKE